MANEREMTPPPGFSTPPHIPNINTTERPPVTTTVFAATILETRAYRASTLTDPAPMISLAFVEANYEILESILRDRRRQIRIEDLRTELEYFRFEEAPNKERSRIGRNIKGNGPSEAAAEENGRQEMNLPYFWQST
nr:reverse transcriptase domain-containing protein [Tanacetum cinerariifolium]